MNCKAPTSESDGRLTIACLTTGETVAAVMPRCKQYGDEPDAAEGDGGPRDDPRVVDDVLPALAGAPRRIG
jgi:hypothetical protein